MRRRKFGGNKKPSRPALCAERQKIIDQMKRGVDTRSGRSTGALAGFQKGKRLGEDNVDDSADSLTTVVALFQGVPCAACGIERLPLG